MTKQARNVAASVHQRLLNRATERGEDFNLTLIQYALERFLYRLSKSEYRDQFVLKGALLFRTWGDQTHRPTKDLDLLGKGIIEIARFERIFEEIARIPVVEDGISFDPRTVRGEHIKEQDEYMGLRLRVQANLGKARISVQVDIGFGDVIVPEAKTVSYPVMLELPPPTLLGYPRESVVSEKYQAMVMLGLASTRLKDFYDLWLLSRTFDFDGPVLAGAIEATFERRKTALPSGPPAALSDRFSQAPDKQNQWAAFVHKNRLSDHRISLEETVEAVVDFVMPPTVFLVFGDPFDMKWPPPGPWKPSLT